MTAKLLLYINCKFSAVLDVLTF